MRKITWSQNNSYTLETLDKSYSDSTLLKTLVSRTLLINKTLNKTPINTQNNAYTKCPSDPVAESRPHHSQGWAERSWVERERRQRARAHPILAGARAPLPAPTAPAHGSAPAVYKIKPLFRARAKGRTTRRAASNRIKVSWRLVCAAGAAGPAPAARSNVPQIKGAAARSASVIIIMQALRGARDSGERSTRAARAPRRLPLPRTTYPPPVNETAPGLRPLGFRH